VDSRDIQQDFILKGKNLTAELLREQEALLTKYKVIEGLPDWPLNLDLPQNQIIVKDFIARVTEELAEADEYFRRINEGELGLQELMQEEIIDALHFFLGVLILVGKDNVVFDLDQSQLSMDDPVYLPFGLNNIMHEINYYIFIARNELKNKPWKQTQLPTDKETFFDRLRQAGVMINVMLYSNLRLTSEEIYTNYMKKNTINKFRQKSQY